MKIFGIPVKRAPVRRALNWNHLYSGPEWQTIKGAGSGPSTWLPVVYGCLRLLSKRLSSMPIRLLNSDGSERPLPRWLREPNQWLSTRQFVESGVHALLMHGAWTVLPQRDGAGRVTAVSVPEPSRVSLQVDDAIGGTGEIAVHIDGERYPGEALYTPWMTLPGSPVGISAVGALRVVSRIGSAAQDYVQQFLDNGMVHQYVISAKDANSDTLEELAAVMRAKHSGPEMAWWPLMLTGDVKVTPISMNLQDAQFLELAQWSDARIASQVFGIDPSILGIVLQGAQLTYNTTLHREANLWVDALKGLAVLIEDVCTKLSPQGTRVDLDERVNLEGSIRDRATVAQALSAVTVGSQPAFAVNEIRELLGFPPIEGGDEIPEPVAPPVPFGSEGEEAEE